MLDDDYLPSRLITFQDHWSAAGRPDPLDALWLLGRYAVRVMVAIGVVTDPQRAFDLATEDLERAPKLPGTLEALNRLAGTDYTERQAIAAIVEGAAVAVHEDPIDLIGDTERALREIAFCGTMLNGISRRDIHTMN